MTSKFEPAAAPPPGDPMVTHVTHRAMATQFVVLLPAHQADRVEEVVEALELLDDIEDRLTIYRDHSEVSRINQNAGGVATKVSRQTFQIIEKAKRWCEVTDGAIDITVGPLIDAWGFKERSGRKPTPDQIDAARQKVGWQNIELSPTERTVRLAKPGMSLNLGSIGKGDALDRLKRHLLHCGIDDFLIHGGSSSVLARGDQCKDSGLGWAVGIAHPTKRDSRLCGIWLKDAAIGTSGSGRQFFHFRGRRYGHVIDPRSGLPSGDRLSVTTRCTGAADADALATAMFVAGTDVMDPCDDTIAVIDIRPSDRQDEVDVQSTGNWLFVDETVNGATPN